VLGEVRERRCDVERLVDQPPASTHVVGVSAELARVQGIDRRDRVCGQTALASAPRVVEVRKLARPIKIESTPGRPASHA